MFSPLTKARTIVASQLEREVTGGISAANHRRGRVGWRGWDRPARAVPRHGFLFGYTKCLLALPSSAGYY